MLLSRFVSFSRYKVFHLFFCWLFLLLIFRFVLLGLNPLTDISSTLLELFLRADYFAIEKVFLSSFGPRFAEMKTSVHDSIRIFEQSKSKIFLRHFFATVPHANSQILHLSNFAGIGATIEILSFCETSVIGIQTFLMSQVDASCDFFMADPKAITQLCPMCYFFN